MTMTMDELTELLHRLLAGWENEVVEFKEAARLRLTPKSGQVVVWSGGLEGRLVGLSGQVVFVL